MPGARLSRRVRSLFRRKPAGASKRSASKRRPGATELARKLASERAAHARERAHLIALLADAGMGRTAVPPHILAHAVRVSSPAQRRRVCALLAEHGLCGSART